MGEIHFVKYRNVCQCVPFNIDALPGAVTGQHFERAAAMASIVGALRMRCCGRINIIGVPVGGIDTTFAHRQYSIHAGVSAFTAHVQNIGCYRSIGS